MSIWRLKWAHHISKIFDYKRITAIPSTVVLWEGVSQLDNKTPIFVVATRAGTAPSGNIKTGDMVQVAIYQRDLSPFTAWAEGKDGAVCPSSCPHRSRKSGGTGACYVAKYRLRSSWNASKEAPRIDRLEEFGRGAVIRIGMEADPSAAPIEMWRRLTEHATRWTGYTAKWRTLPDEWRELFMASVSTPEEAATAEKLGWRVFAASSCEEDDVAYSERGIIQCHYDTVQLQCENCGLCDGTSRGSKRPGVFTKLHGPVGRKIRSEAAKGKK